jgi:hypothetical protein
MTCSSSGDPEETSNDVPVELLRLMQIDVLSAGSTVAVTPSLMTIPVPTLPVVAMVSPTILLK